MRIFNKFKDTKGFVSIWERVIRFRYMITEQAKERCRILAFWEKYGTLATKEAFGVSRPTLFRWQRKLKESMGKLDSLNKKSTGPRNKRKRTVLPEVESFIIKERTIHPKLGKEKLSVLLKQKGFNLSASTIGRIINDLKLKGKLLKQIHLSLHGHTGNLYELKVRKTKKIRRPKKYEKQCLEVDTIIRFIDGIKRYIVTAIDCQNKFSFAYAYTSHTSKTTADFLEKLQSVYPRRIESIQTDNGSEFMENFRLACAEENITHFHTYPRCPKMNSMIERFNRTLTEEFLVYNRAIMRDELVLFNKRLMEYLLWYNTERPHHSLGLISPLRYITNQLSVQESQMWWTNTSI